MADRVDLFALDRDVARAVTATSARWRRVRDGTVDADDAPLEGALRWTSTRPTFAALAAEPAGDALAAALRRWVFRLALARIARERTVAAASARAAPRLLPERLAREPVGAAEVVRRALAERDLARRRAWLAVLEEDGGRIAAAHRAESEAMVEIAAQLGVADARTLAWPCGPDALVRAADATLAATADLARELTGDARDLAALIERTLARDVAGVWPAHLVPRTLAAPFVGTELMADVRLDLGALPPALGAASWARAHARLGAAWSRGAAARGASFALAHDATDARPLRRGALFASLVADRVFLRRALGLSRDAAASAARAVSASLVVAARLAAARTLLGDARASAADVEARMSGALGVAVPRSFAFVLPRADARAPLSLLGALLAAGDRAALVARHDEDWFANPRALAELRGEEGAATAFDVPDAALDGAPAALARALEDAAR